MSLHSILGNAAPGDKLQQPAKLPVLAMEKLEDFAQLASRCAPYVHPSTMAALVHVESDYNPYAIGIVGGSLSKQPRTMEEALTTVAQLEKEGRNFSLGLGQINRYNLQRHNVDYQEIFEPCRNLAVGAAILTECFTRAKVRFPDDQTALRASLSCYYSGNFTTGHQHGYVKKVVAQAGKPSKAIPVVPAIILSSSDLSSANDTAHSHVATAIKKSHPKVVLEVNTQSNRSSNDDDIYSYVSHSVKKKSANAGEDEIESS